MKCLHTLVSLLFAAVAVLSGCNPGDIDNTMINRYQAEMAARSPQPRRSDMGGGLLEPTGALCPKLELTQEPNGTVVKMTLNEAVMRALANNLDIRVISFDPEIAREDMIKAAAAFDVTVFGSYGINDQHTHPASTSTPEQVHLQTAEAGVRQLVPTGGTWAISHSLQRSWDNGALSTLPLNYQNVMALEVTQPLLRDAWPEFNLAKLKIAQTTRKSSEADFRNTLEQTIAQVVAQYWTLWQSRREVIIRQELLQTTIDTLHRMQARGEIDAAAAQIKQAEAAVKDTQIQLERAVKAVADSQDSLAQLLADPQVNLVSNLEIVPISDPAQSPLSINVAEQLLTALEHNPQLARARLAIELSEINVTIADNQTLPRLDFKGRGSYQGLAGTYEPALHEMGDMSNFSFGASLSFEYPLGNRAALADLARTKLERLKAVSQMQNLADQIAQAVRERSREIGRSYREIQLTRELIEAKKAELQALMDLEEIRGRLTPEFLQLKLSTQNQLADAKSGELRAVQGYNTAVVGLAQVTGTILKTYSVDLALPSVMGESEWPKRNEK